MKTQILSERRRFGESFIFFQSDRRDAIDAAISVIRNQRMELETYVSNHSEFRDALSLIEIENSAPTVVKLMAESTRSFDVGPMAAVAGVLADLAVKAMLGEGAKVAIVEDGGEISAVSNEAFTVALHAGKSTLSNRLGFQILSSDCPIGVATSSATVSHALSFGQADAATIFADTAGVADGAATAVCNSVRGNDVEASIREGLEYARKFDSLIRGAVIVREKHVGSVGKIPRLVQIEGDLFSSEASQTLSRIMEMGNS